MSRLMLWAVWRCPCKFFQEWNPTAADDETDARILQAGDYAQQFKKNRAFASGRKVLRDFDDARHYSRKPNACSIKNSACSSPRPLCR